MKLARWPGLWLLAAVGIVAGFTGASVGMQEYQNARTCLFSRLFFQEIEQVLSLRTELTAQASPSAPEISFALDLMDNDVLLPRREYHFELARVLGIDPPGTETSAADTPPSPINSHLAWLEELKTQLSRPEQCRQSWFSPNLQGRIFARIRSQAGFQKLQKTHQELASSWIHLIPENRELAFQLRADFERDRSLLCHSRKSLGNTRQMEFYLKERCQQPGYQCQPHLTRIDRQVRELASVEQTNASKFAEKWGATRLRSKLCDY